MVILLFLLSGLVASQVELISHEYHSASGTSSFVYSVSSSSIVSWTLGLDNCVEIQPYSAIPSTSLTLALDPVTQISGLKWQTSSNQYRLEVQGHVKVGSTSFGIDLGAYKIVTGIVDGPVCGYYEDVVCDAGGPYSAVCHNNELSVHLLGHQSLHATAYEWKHFIPGANLLTPTSVASVIELPVDVCQETYRVTLTVTGKDPSDQRTCLAYIFVNDALAPVFDNVYEGDISVEPHDIPAAMVLSAHDDCDPNVKVHYTEDRVESGRPCAYELHRVWTAVDSCENSATHTQIISVIDTEAPVLSGIEEDNTYQCDAVPPPCVVEGNDYNPVTVEMTEFKNEGQCDCEYSVVRKWVATDCAGNKATASQKVTVVDNEPPTIYGVPDDDTVSCDQVPSIPSPSAVDNCCDATLSYYDSKTTGSCLHDHILVRTWTATDSCGYKSTRSQNIQVEDIIPPTLSHVADDITVDCNEIPLPCEVEATDNCDDYVTVEFTENTVPLGDGCTEIITYRWVATDKCGNTANTQQQITVRDDEDPILSGLPPHSLTVDCDAIPQFFVKVSDNCDPDITVDLLGPTKIEDIYQFTYTEVYTWRAVDDCGNDVEYVTSLTVQDNEDPILIGVPDDYHVSCDSLPDIAKVEGLDNCCSYALDPVVNDFTTEGTCEDSYTKIIIWTLEDCNHNSVSASQTIYVEDVEAPTIHGLPGYEVIKCDEQPIDVVVTVTDNCDEGVTYEYESDTVQGSCSTQYKILRTWSATDVCGNAFSYTQTVVTYDDHAPVLSDVPKDTTVQCEYNYDGIVPSVEDNCDPYITIIPTHSKTEGTCDYDKVWYRHWYAADDCGNSVTAAQTVTIIDDEPPTWTTIPPEMITSEYPEEPDMPVVTAEDNCQYAPEITESERKLQFGYVCAKAYRLVRAWFVIDVCGNMGPPIYQHVVIDDHRAPQFMEELDDDTVECDVIPPPPPMFATDHYEEITVTMKEETSFGTCNNDYDIIRTWYAEDSCGNLNTTTQVISVYDNTPPVFYNSPADMSVECEPPAPAQVSAEDNCDGYLDVTFDHDDVVVEVDYTSDSSSAWKTVYRQWSVRDTCGNVATVAQTISVYDTKDPTFSKYATNVVYECDEVPSGPPTVRYDDECDPNPSASLETEKDASEGACLDPDTIIYTWTVTDFVNHQATFSQTVTIVDTTPPVLSGYAQDTIEVECDSIPDQGGMTASDNCDYDVVPVPTSTVIPVDLNCADRKLILWVWTATDDCGNDASYTKTVRVDDTTPPELLCDGEPCADYEVPDVECDDQFITQYVTATATDNCDNDITPVETHITEHGTCEDTYLKISTYIATDDCGNSVTWVRTLSVSDTTPPVWVDLPPQTKTVPYDGDVMCPTDLLSATDNCDENVNVQCSAVIDNGKCDQEYTKTCSCYAEDNCGNKVTFVQVINVFDDEAPEIVQPSHSTVECLTSLVAPSEPEVKWGYSSGSLTVTSRTVPGDCTYTVIYTWLAIDECHLQDTVDQTIFVEDNNGPVISGVPADETVECHPGAPIEYLTGHDECDGKVLVMFDSEKINDNGPYCYTLVRKWSAVDHCGQITNEDQTVVVEDNEAPSVTYPPSHLTTDCHSLPLASEDDVQVVDNCDPVRNVSFTDERDDGSCDCEWTQYRTWVACDSCGNCASVYQTVSVIDDISPSLSLYPGDLTVQTGDVPYPPDVIGLDNYGSTTEVNFTEIRENSTYAAGSTWVYKLYRSWVTADGCGNTDYKEQTITVIDTIPVIITGVPKDVVLECPTNASIPPEYSTATIEAAIEAALPTDEDVTLFKNVDMWLPGSCENEWNWIRCWQTEDHSQNTHTACFTITSVDNVPPFWLNYPEVEFAECEPEPFDSVIPPEADDNCECGPTVTGEEFDNRNNGYSGNVVRIWTATDCCGATALHSQTIWVSDSTPPTWEEEPADSTICCDETVPTVEMKATDGCHPDVTVVGIDWKEVICEGEYILYYTWRATDSTGNWISYDLQIYVEDCYTPELFAGLAASYDENNAIPIADSTDHANLEVECPWVETFKPIYATDQCLDYQIDVSIYDITRWGGYCDRNVLFYWNVVDDCGHEASWSQTVNIKDTTPPVISGCPEEQVTKHCGETLDKAYVSGSDECDPLVEVVRDEKIIPGTCDNEYSSVVTWSIEDHCGLTDSCSQTTVFEDREVPVLILHGPEAITVDCTIPYEAPSVSASDDCQEYFTIDFDQQQEEGSCPCEYEVTRTWTTKDKCEHSTSVTQHVTVEDNEPPVIHGVVKDTTVPCHHLPPKPSLTASDNCCEVTLDYTADTKDGSCDSEYDVIRKWVATDECGHSAEAEYTITVVDNENPTFNPHFLQHFIKVECSDVPLQGELTATDDCGEVTVTPVEYRHDGSCLDEYALVRVWTAVDICGNSASFVQTVSVVDTTPPTLELPEEESYECGSIPDMNDGADLPSTDNCDDAPTVIFNSQMMGADCSDSWSVLLLWVTRDRCGNEATYSLVVPVDDTIYPTLVGVPDDTTVECDLPDVPHVTATDNCDHLLTPTFEQELPYAECPYVYTALRTWSVTDRCLNTVSETQTITVTDDGDPQLSPAPESTTMGCKDTLVPEKLVATDHCQKALSVDVDSVTIPGSCSYQYVIIVTWTANDACGGTDSASQTVTVNDDAAPTMSTIPDSTTVECDSIPPAGHVYANDACSYAVEVEFSETTQNLVCDNEYDLVRQWIAKDECGNVVTGTQTIKVEDTTPPSIPYSTEDFIEAPCDDVPPMQTFTPSDNCDGYISYKENEERIEEEPCDNHLLVRTYTVTDACGNEYVDEYTVSVKDEEAPVIIYAPADATVECDEYTDPEAAVAQDNCHEVTVTPSEITIPDEDCDYLYKNIYTWVAQDECGLTDDHIQTVTHVDTTAPVISGHDDVTCEIGNIPPPWKCEYTDNCDGAGSEDYTPVKEPGSCDHQYTITYTCVVEDCEGNTATASHVVHVFDFIPPVLIGVPADTTVEYQKVPLLSNAHRGVSVTDNSDSYTGQVYSATLVVPIPEVKIPGYDANDYTLIRTFTAEDDCGNRVQSHQTITVIDNTPPCFDEYPDNIEVECDSIPEPCEIFTVGENLVVSFYETKDQQSDYSFVIKRRWVAADHSGNAETHVQLITVRDNTAPVFTRQPVTDLYVDCDCEDLPAMAVIGAVDNCDEFVTVDKSSVPTVSDECEDKYTITRTWTVSDHVGNENSWTQVIHVVDNEPPQYSETPSNVTYDCDEESFSMPPKVLYVDNCDPDPIVDGSASEPSSEVSPDGGCTTVYHYSVQVIDRCGNAAPKITWHITFRDTTPPIAHGSKHCVHNRQVGDYGSMHLYKKYDVSSLYSASDSCSDGVRLVGVYFNRSSDDTSNLFESADVRINSGRYEQEQETETVLNLFTKTGVDYYMRVAIENPLAFGGIETASCRLTVWSSHATFSPIAGRSPKILYEHIYTPKLRNGYQDYDVHFVSESSITTVEFQCDRGLMWQLGRNAQFPAGEGANDRYPSCRTSHGEGVWAPATYDNVPLRCAVGPVLATGPAFKCNAVTYEGLIWRAVSNRKPVNDRYCFVHPNRPWLSITSYAFDDGSVWWVITNFAAENPSAYVWNNFENDLANERRMNPNGSPDSLLGGLLTRGTIDKYWRESVEFSPVDGPETSLENMNGIVCHITPGQLPEQCQAACYQKGFNTAWKYDSSSSMFNDECHCGTNCDEDQSMGWMVGNVGTYKLWHWMEGFYITEEGDVYVLAYTLPDQNDLKINMWVIVEDDCSNRATTLVEFWIAPTVEAAASVGRQCDEADYTPVEVGQGSFTSSVVVVVSTGSSDDVLPIEQVTWASLLSNGLILGAVGNTQSLFTDEDTSTANWLTDNPQMYVGRISVSARITAWSVDLGNIMTACRRDIVASSSIINLDDFPWAGCASLRGRVSMGELSVTFNWAGTSSNKVTKTILKCQGRICSGITVIDIRDYYDDIRRDAAGNVVPLGEHEFLQLDNIIIQNAGPYPLGVRSISLEYVGAGVRSYDEYDYGVDAAPSWQQPLNSNLRVTTLIHECKTSSIDWCSFDFYISSLNQADRDTWIQRQINDRDAAPGTLGFRNSLTITGFSDFSILAPAPRL